MIFYLCFPFINMLAIKVLFCRLLFHQAYYVASRFCLLCLLCMYCLVCLRSCLLFVYLFVCLLFCLFVSLFFNYLRRHDFSARVLALFLTLHAFIQLFMIYVVSIFYNLCSVPVWVWKECESPLKYESALHWLSVRLSVAVSWSLLTSFTVKRPA